MEFIFNDEQNLLRDSVAKFVKDTFSLEKRQETAKEGKGYSDESWKTFAELGWLGIPFAEEDGGIDWSAIETCIVMEELGKGLVLEPYVPTVILAGSALRFAGSPEQKHRYIPGIIEGSLQGGFAYAEAQSRYNNYNVVTKAEKSGDSWVLSGTKGMVYNAQAADFLVVTARTAGGQQDRDGISTFIVDTGADGVTVRDYITVDGLHAAEVDFSGAPAELLGEEGKGADVIDTVIQEGILAVSAEAVGAMEVLYKSTVEYTSQREQFDHPLSDFQVLKHRMVDMFMQTELARALLEKAMREHAEGMESAAETIHGLKVLVGQAGRFVGQNAVQLHGGMGMTEELEIGHYFKRLTVINAMFGDSDHHLQQYIGA